MRLVRKEQLRRSLWIRYQISDIRCQISGNYGDKLTYVMGRALELMQYMAGPARSRGGRAWALPERLEVREKDQSEWVRTRRR